MGDSKEKTRPPAALEEEEEDDEEEEVAADAVLFPITEKDEKEEAEDASLVELTVDGVRVDPPVEVVEDPVDVFIKLGIKDVVDEPDKVFTRLGASEGSEFGADAANKNDKAAALSRDLGPAAADKRDTLATLTRDDGAAAAAALPREDPALCSGGPSTTSSGDGEVERTSVVAAIEVSIGGDYCEERKLKEIEQNQRNKCYRFH